ncbi:nostrin-like [Halichondria panicea]|uniref:nostrin-like n=1 Tax=Halichondria panicea TaxID=6063 RepID=UPI00312B830D
MGTHFQECFWVGNGFEELKGHMRKGTDFCKDLESLLADRAELEKEYSNGLHKIIKKARKNTRHPQGSVEDVWGRIVSSLEYEEETHRTLAASLSQEGSKVMKAFIDTQVKTRDPAVSAVDKQLKQFMDKHKSQLKNKRSAYKSCRDLETNWEQLKDMKSGKSVKTVAEKDITKMERSCRKMEESLVKADREYRDSNIKTEESRLGWESAMYKCCNVLETLEYERIQQVQTMVNKYCELLQSIIRPLEDGTQDIATASDQISPEGDIETTCTTVGTGPNQPEQLLLDYFEEDLSNGMDADRRRTSLEKKIQHMEVEIERQQRARAGVEQLAKVYREQPDFTDEKGAEDVTRQLVEADCLLNMLKANHFKLLGTHAEISRAPRPSSHFSDYISSSTDKHNQPVSFLKIPPEEVGDVKYEPPSLPSGGGVAYSGGGAAYNGEDVGDEFDDPNEGGGTLEFDEQDAGGLDYVGECKVLYEYDATQEDELTVRPDDIIKIIEKFDTEWWQGEVNGQVGVFPSSYVEEL